MYQENNRFTRTPTPRGELLPEREPGMGESGGCTCQPTCTPDCPAPVWGLCGYPLAMVYAPVQEFCDLYDLDTALQKGTVFGALDLPLVGCKGGTCHD